MAGNTWAQEVLPPRPNAERPVPPGAICHIGTVDQKCFTLDEWKDLGHLVLDYRVLLDWAPRAEALYATQVARAALNEGEAMVQKGAADAALAREAIAQERAREARAKADAEHARARRLGVFAGVLGGCAVVLGAVVTGMALSR
jgi:hypothetical protein